MNGKEEKIGLIYHADYLIHTQGQHPERKERLEHIMAALEDNNLFERVVLKEPAPAEIDDVTLVHDPDYIKLLDEVCRSGRNFLDMDTYIVPESYRIALLSAGGVLTGLRMVMEGDVRKAFALNRPPGHHAERGRAMGFCLMNNIAITAEVAKRDYGLKRIVIMDWDVHHGNGTQHIFEKDNEVLFISTHQNPAYPGTGSMEEVGKDLGEGFTVNIPLPTGSGDEDYKLFFDHLIIPVIGRFEPEIILISAGQDAYRYDPLAGMGLTYQGYYNMALALSDAAEHHCGGKLVLCLEGGYHLTGQAGAVVQVLNALGNWGLPIGEQSPGLEPNRFVLQRLQEILEIQKRYWDI
ncbi:MAG: histone deacetylase [Bacillota bacterium]|nr:histone deacetylase [Bacillota bacterium]